ncbi:GtrA family protein [Cellulomonas sp. P24]|uniref:GtrA family protein n=1 Tax=Cellulomonas sp. P24 TaxID=2885206 RepID=UPI00216AE45D|nr:GtrA family protein [Cellulomonas sp. P24]MCR6491747.1 GtrA family protein [Cellulomonas sp. P24]
MFTARVIRFLVVGGAAATLEFIAFESLVLVGVDPVFANVMSFVLGMTTSFLGYRRWSFAGEHLLGLGSQFGAYLTLAAFNALASSVIIHELTAEGVRPWVSKIGCMALIACWNYLLLNRLVFRRKRLGA